MKDWRTLRPSTWLITIYASICGAWAAFAYGAAPGIITGAYLGRSQPILNRAFQGHRSLPLGDYLDLWRGIAAAVLIVIILHFVIVLFVTRLSRIHPRIDIRSRKIEADGNIVLIVFSAVFLLTTVITWIRGDYSAYVTDWQIILRGQKPWASEAFEFNAYGPLFSLMAIATFISPVANKLLFSFSYVLYVIWLIKKLSPSQGVNIPSWFWFCLLILNPFPWEQIACFGYFDVLVGIACVASLHSFFARRDRLSGAFLSLGILLKFMPIVILPFLAFSDRRLNWRLVAVCISVVALGFLTSVLIWGTSAFAPLDFAATRNPQWSIYTLTNSTYLPFRLIPKDAHVENLEKTLLFLAILAVLLLYELRYVGLALSATIAILVTLLFYREGYANYKMVLFCLVTYWVASEWRDFGRHRLMGVFLIAYFTFMTLADLDIWEWKWQRIFHPNVMVFSEFLLGCLMLAGLLRFSVIPAGDETGSPSVETGHSPRNKGGAAE